MSTIQKGNALETLRNLVFQALGEASMCWKETPAGEFDSEHAVEIGNTLMAAIQDFSATQPEVMPV